MIDHFFFYFALLIEKLKRISVKVAYSAALMFRNVNICESEGVSVFIRVDKNEIFEFEAKTKIFLCFDFLGYGCRKLHKPRNLF